MKFIKTTWYILIYNLTWQLKTRTTVKNNQISTSVSLKQMKQVLVLVYYIKHFTLLCLSHILRFLISKHKATMSKAMARIGFNF